jgi:general secretion pathway protein E/type IV pilus assembly protein PilB
MAKLNIMERRLPQDGRVAVRIGDRSIDMRVATIPAHGGESIVVRLFPSLAGRASLEDLGFRPKDRLLLEAASLRSAGLFLVTGPTGSGKSTTLNALLRFLKSDERKLITIEDPIEQVIPGVVQIQTNDRIGLTFDRLLRHVLRQDPNIIMVGEIRDTATAELVGRASLTGHMVLSTLHTSTSSAAVARLRNLGVPAYLISEVLNVSVAQRLVRRLCPWCRAESAAPAVLKKEFEKRGRSIETIYTRQGCPRCRQTGYIGRIPLLEVFLPNMQTRLAMAAECPTNSPAISDALVGGRTLLEDGLDRIKAGETTIEEIQREVDMV